MDENTMEQGLERSQAGRKLKEAVQCIGQDMRTAASSVVERVGNIGKRTREEGGKKVGELESRVEGYVQNHPLKTLAAAVGAGLVLGWLTKKR